MNKIIKVYTDGACKGNPGPGGYGVVILNLSSIDIISGKTEDTTNNRMELTAILKAFEYAQKNKQYNYVIYSDSAYCVNICNNWIYNWARNNWLNSKNKTIENLDLIQSLYKYLTIDFFNCQVEKVKGHDKDIINELADAVATENEKKINKFIELAKLQYGYKN